MSEPTTTPPPKPADVVRAYAAQVAAANDFAADVRQAVGAYLRTFGQISGHVLEFSALCKRRGKTHILAALPPDVAAAFDASLPHLRTLWESLSSNPFPELPDEPLPPEPEPAPEGGEA